MVLQVGAAYGIPERRAALLQHLRPAAGALQPVHRRGRDLQRAAAERQAAAHLRGRRQSRDFVSVHDVVQALLLAAEKEDAVGKAFNVGSGPRGHGERGGRDAGRVLGVDVEPQVTGRYRVGDIRHCFADISRPARRSATSRGSLSRRDGELVEWLQEQEQAPRTGW
jgi:dTDP-L-rhamnose 4-epimerase